MLALTMASLIGSDVSLCGPEQVLATGNREVPFFYAIYFYDAIIMTTHTNSQGKYSLLNYRITLVKGVT